MLIEVTLGVVGTAAAAVATQRYFHAHEKRVEAALGGLKALDRVGGQFRETVYGRRTTKMALAR